MCFLGHRAHDDAPADHAGADRAVHGIDLAAGEWSEVEQVPPRADDRLGVSTILSFWVVAAVLLLVIVAVPALEAAAHRFH